MYSNISLTSVWSSSHWIWFSLKERNSFRLLHLQSGSEALLLIIFFTSFLFKENRSIYLITNLSKIVLIFTSIYDELDKSVFLKKLDMYLFSCFRPCIKNPSILLIKISTIGIVSITLWSKYERVQGCNPNIFLLHTLHLVHSSLVFGLSSCQSWHPYKDEHWLVNKATLACQDIGLNLLVMTLVRTFISFIIESILMIEFDTWNKWPRCFSDFTFVQKSTLLSWGTQDWIYNTHI